MSVVEVEAVVVEGDSLPLRLLVAGEWVAGEVDSAARKCHPRTSSASFSNSKEEDSAEAELSEEETDSKLDNSS